MKLFYNDIAIHDYGQIVISSQKATGKPEAAPQWWEHRMKVKVLFKEPTYADNYSLVTQVRAALKSKQQATLLWNDDNGNELLNQTATIVDLDRPENPNEKGTYFQTIEITFEYNELFGSDQNNSVVATFQRAGASTPLITLGYVEGVKYTQDVRRYSPFRSHRESASGRIEIRGRFAGDPLSDVDTRRAALLAAADQMRSEIALGKDGRFVFASIDKIVRVDNFFAEYDQHLSFIPWSLSASFTEFPNESGYAQAEFTVDTRQDIREGKTILALSGTIAAQSEVNAQAKLSSIRTSVAPSSTWTMLRGGGGRAEKIDGEDGATFIRLSFEEEFEKTTASLVEWDLRLSDSDDVTAGMIRRTYSGHVLAVGADFQTAYAIAVTKAKALGDTKHQFKIGGSITCDDKQASAQRQTSGSLTVNVEFSFEYRLKSASRVYAEISSRFTGETFGLDVESISGFVSASTVDTARAIYSTIKGGYSSYMIRSEEVTESRSKIQNGTADGTNKTPPNLTSGTSINAGEAVDNTEVTTPLTRGPVNPPPLGVSYSRHWNRLDFSFAIHRPKSSQAGSVAIRYEFDVTNDYLAKERTTHISGTVWAATEAAANAFLDTYFAGSSVGEQTMSRRSASYEKAPPSALSKFTERADPSSKASVFTALTFDDQYLEHLDQTGIIKCSIREHIDCSGDRTVVQPTASGPDIFQTCGEQSGRRTLSLSVTATNETLCLTWIKAQMTMPIGTGFTKTGETAAIPPQFDLEFESIPLRQLKARNVDGTPYTGSEKAKFVTMSGTVEELCTQLVLA